MTTMLIADDNKQISKILGTFAEKEGFNIVYAYDGEETLLKFNEVQPNVILLDVMMPKLDGFQVCREIRRQSDIPVIMVTARGEDFERIMGLDIGADDYVVKPFSSGEVMARVRAVLRRAEKKENSLENIFCYDNLVVNIDDYSVCIDNKKVSLTKKEIDLLWTLAIGRNKVFTRDNLLDSLWGYDYYGDSRTVDTHMKRLRAKLDVFEHNSWELKTVRGVGYKFEVKQDEK